MMKILSWNCCGNFKEKIAFIMAFDWDIAIIQECENPETIKVRNKKEEAIKKAFFNCFTSYQWIGESKNKGLGIFSRNKELKMDERFSNMSSEFCKYGDSIHELKYFLPVKLDDLTIVAVWCHKADDNIFHYIGQLWKYLLLNELFINSNTLFMGDFNASKIWDNECGWWSFSTVNKIFNQKKLYSYYHAARNEAFGEEKEHTYYHQWNKNKPFHIDYMYGSLERLKENSFRILSSDFVLKLSDHAPLFCEIKT